MRKFIVTAAIIAGLLPAFPAMAQIIDLDAVCQPGCVIGLDISVGKFSESDGEVVGRFMPSTIEDPMAFVVSFVRTQNPQRIFQLVGEAGKPMFGSIDDVQTYMKGYNYEAARLIKLQRDPTS